MRDVTLEDTFRHGFTTRAFATGIPTVLSDTPVLSVLEENNATPITAGVSVSVDRASVVGLNEATIVATAANGYESGKSYSIYISTGTVGGVSVVGEVVGHFTIAASAAAVDLANATDGLGALKTLIDAIPTTAMRGTDGVDTATMRGTDGVDPATMRGTDSAATAANLAIVDTVVDAIKAVTDLLPDAGALNDLAAILVDTDTTIPTLIAALNDLSAAQVNAEVLDVMNVDTFSLPPQEAPPLAPTLREALLYWYKQYRNRATQDAAGYELFADDGTTVDQKATDSDDTTTADKGKIVSGP